MTVASQLPKALAEVPSGNEGRPALWIGWAGGYWGVTSERTRLLMAAFDSGYITSAADYTHFTDSNGGWATNALVNYEAKAIRPRSGVTARGKVTANSATQVTIDAWEGTDSLDTGWDGGRPGGAYAPPEGDLYVLQCRGTLGDVDDPDGLFYENTLNIVSPGTMYGEGDGLKGVPIVAWRESMGATNIQTAYILSYADGTFTMETLWSAGGSDYGWPGALNSGDKFCVGARQWRWKSEDISAESLGGSDVRIRRVRADVSMDLGQDEMFLCAKLYTSGSGFGRPETSGSYVLVAEGLSIDRLAHEGIRVPGEWGKVVALELTGVALDHRVRIRNIEADLEVR